MGEARGTMLFCREFKIRGPADGKPREASVVLRRGSTRWWAKEYRSGRVGAYRRAGEMTDR